MWLIFILFTLFYPFLQTQYHPKALLSASLIFLINVSIFIFKKNKRLPTQTFLNPATVFLLICILSILFISPTPGKPALITAYLCLLGFFITARIINPKEKQDLINALLLGSILICFYSIIGLAVTSGAKEYYAYMTSAETYFIKDYLSRNRAFLPFTTPNLLASYLGMIFFISLYNLINNLSNKGFSISRLISIISCLLATATLWLTKSIAAFISLLLALLFFSSMTKKFNKKLLSAAIILLLSVTAIRHYGSSSELSLSASVTNRLTYWRETVQIIKENYLYGIGLGSLKIESAGHSHNSHLQITAEMGFLGLISWITVILYFFKIGIRKIKSNLKPRFLLISCGLFFLVHNLFDFSFYLPPIAFIWWITLALSTADGQDNLPELK